MCAAHAKLELEPRMCVSLNVNQQENVTCEVCSVHTSRRLRMFQQHLAHREQAHREVPARGTGVATVGVAADSQGKACCWRASCKLVVV